MTERFATSVANQIAHARELSRLRKERQRLMQTANDLSVLLARIKDEAFRIDFRWDEACDLAEALRHIQSLVVTAPARVSLDNTATPVNIQA